jgi:hypothetical protein
MHTMRRILSAVVGALVLCVAGGVGAQEQDEALATELFNAGRDLMAEGRYAEACPKLAESVRLDPAVGTLGKLASCEERIGKLMLARTHWQQALNRARSENDQRLPLIESELRRLDGLVPKIKLMAPSVRPAGMRVTLDGTSMSDSSLGVAVPVDPGPHRLEVFAPGKETKVISLELMTDGAITTVRLPSFEEPVAAAAAPEPTEPQPVVAAPVTEVSTHPLRSVGLVVAGVGAVGVGVGAYFGGLAKSRLDESNELGCDGASCPPDAADKRNDARDAGNVSTVFFLAGGALVAGGLGLWVFGPEDRETSAPRVSAAPVAAPGGGGLVMRGAW